MPGRMPQLQRLDRAARRRIGGAKAAGIAMLARKRHGWRNRRLRLLTRKIHARRRHRLALRHGLGRHGLLLRLGAKAHRLGGWLRTSGHPGRHPARDAEAAGRLHSPAIGVARHDAAAPKVDGFTTRHWLPPAPQRPLFIAADITNIAVPVK